ncbi:MAG TPA: type II toxin-antitoxin system HicB family antitoxin [Longimicrobium sp.]|jgi:predicted RNase H-like HicB family nuclease
MNNEHRYELIVHWSDEDNAFISLVPELPGCAADGATYAESVANVEMVIDEWISVAREMGRVVPRARGRLFFA